jgi:PncC family amidohydrolase
MTPPSPEQLLELSRAVGRQLAAAQHTIATAESCTGGLIASTLTDLAGSSDYVLGGVVSYSNQVKLQLLGVRPDTLQSHGAVSPETAAEMAQGVRRLLHVDVGVSATGIAGPGGASPDKPVGLVYLHLSAADREWGERHVWAYDRLGNKRASVAAALTLVLKYLTESSGPSERWSWWPSPGR